jgi:hypothetical protein
LSLVAFLAELSRFDEVLDFHNVTDAAPALAHSGAGD